MKRFHAFAGMLYYPCSGLGDYVGSYETEEEARKAASKAKHKEGSSYAWSTILAHDEDGSLFELD